MADCLCCDDILEDLVFFVGDSTVRF